MLTLSILIPTIKRHQSLFNDLKEELELQKIPFEGQVEILSDDSETDSVGEKRNRLLERASGEYVAFFDADDKPGKNYMKLLMEAANSKRDCASLKGMYSVDGVEDGIFEHSLKYDKWETVEGAEIKYLRFQNHLNLIQSTIAKQFKFPEKNFGEDFDWSTELHKSGLLKTEYYIPEIIYYYNYVTDKN